MDLGLSFLRGLMAAVNPCGFVLLPTYLAYFLGLEAGRTSTSSATVRRALVVGAAVTGGFMAVFVVIAAVSELVTSEIGDYSKFVTALVGAVLVVLGIAMLTGYRLPLATPRLDVGRRDRTARSMFVYGVAYATVSLSCTIGIFLPTIVGTGRRDGVAAGAASGAAFAAGMGLLVTALTVTLALANHSLVRGLRAAAEHIERFTAALVLLSGLYLLHYVWVVDIKGQDSRIVDAVERPQVWLQRTFTDRWEVAAAGLSAVVAAAVAYVVLRQRPDPVAPVPSPVRDHIDEPIA